MLTKMVDGETVELTEEDEAAVRAEWAANDKAKDELKSKEEKRLELRKRRMRKGITGTITLTSLSKRIDDLIEQLEENGI